MPLASTAAARPCRAGGCVNRQRTCRAGAAALKRLKSGRFDVVISEIDMPNMNGFNLLKAIKADDALKHLPVLMVTAAVRKQDIVVAAQAGPAGHVLKPFSRAMLQDNVQTIMQRMAAIA